MSRPWKVLYYTDKDNRCSIKEFIDSKDERNQAKIMAYLSILEERGPNLPRPYADLLKDGIHELRIKLSGNQTRVLYFFTNKQYIVLTHAFTKTSSAVPPREIQKAAKCRDDFVARFSKELREGIL